MAATEPPQHLRALQHANDIRFRRSAIKAEIRAGTKTIRDVLEVHEVAGIGTLDDVDPAIASMTVADLLAEQPRWGPTRAGKLLASLRIPEARPVGALTMRSRRAIAAALEGVAPRPPLGAIDVECPTCRSGPGQPCSTFDPFRDLWREPTRPHKARVERARGLS
jgi:hypothetical protein